MVFMSKSLVVITGASRGIGRAIALAIADAFVKESSTSSQSPDAPLRMVLIARSADSLQETADLVEQKLDCDTSGQIHTICLETDLSDLDSLPEKFGQLLEDVTSCGSNDYDSCWLINNAGSLGPLGLASSLGGDSSSMKELQNSVNLNVTSGIWLSSQFTKKFLSSEAQAPSAGTGPGSPLVRIANISSLCAVEPFPTMAVYCAGKAGGDMFHQVLAKEHSSVNNNENKDKVASAQEDEGHNNKAKQTFKVLNYAPGPCDTRMTDDLAECRVLDDGLHDYFSSSKREKKLVKTEDTARKLVEILRLDEFVSGSHVDYFDS